MKKLGKALKSRKPAMSDEELSANIEAAEEDFEDTEEDKKTISYREIDPERVKQIEKELEIRKYKALRREKDKAKYDKMMKGE